MVHVKFYGYLKKITKVQSIQTDLQLVEDILKDIFERYTEIKSEFEDGQINVIADQSSLTFPQDMRKVVVNEISLLPLIEGG